MNVRLWLDDERDPAQHGHIGWTWVRTADEAIRLLATGTVVNASLDHDLSIGRTLGYDDGEMTGLDVCLWLEQNPAFWPIEGVGVHSHNETKRPLMLQALHRARMRARDLPPLPEFAWHGTNHAEEILAYGEIRPRGDAPGNWSGGLEGGNPSNPDMVYLTFDKDHARQYGSDTLKVRIPWDRALFDEDVVYEIMKSGDESDWLYHLFWSIYGRQFEADGTSVAEIKDFWENGENLPSDSELAFDMTLVAEKASAMVSVRHFAQRFLTLAVRGAVAVEKRVIDSPATNRRSLRA